MNMYSLQKNIQDYGQNSVEKYIVID